jgi:hypothetical protein
MSTASQPADIRGSDLAIAAMLTTLVLGGSILALAHARLEHAAELPAIDPGMGIPIAVRPVSDISSAGPGKGRREAAKQVVPRAWRRKVPRDPEPQPVVNPTPVHRQPTNKREHEDPVIPATPDDPVAVEPEPTEAATSETGEAPVEDTSAEVEPEDDSPPEADAEGGSEGGTEGESEAETEGEAEGGGGGSGTDPLLERAIAFYRARLVAWFSARFRVTGSGLSPAQLAKYRVRVHIDLGEDLRIVDYRILSSDHPDFEKAAHTMLEKLRGEKLPPPPENYPGAVQHQLTVTFTCAEDTCD